MKNYCRSWTRWRLLRQGSIRPGPVRTRGIKLAVLLWESDAFGQENFGTTPIDRFAVEELAVALLGV